MQRTPRDTSRATYAPDELTYAQRQLMQMFHVPAQRTPEPVAAWAPKFDPLNGKMAGAKEKLGAFGKPLDNDD